MLVDLFHNSAAGVRAQCLHSPALGNLALDHARNVLRSRAIELLGSRRLGTLSKEVILDSLSRESAKVWIHQGLWVRRAKIYERHLRIAKWEQRDVSSDKKLRDLVRYGSKAPESPAAIDLIGAWVHPTEVDLGKAPGTRARQISMYGFT